MKTQQLVTVVAFVLFLTWGQRPSEAQMSNHITKESSSSLSSSSATAGDIAPSGPPPPPPPAFFPGIGAGAGAGFHKNLDLSIGGGAGAGYGPLLASLFSGAQPGPPPPVAAPIPDVPVPPPAPLLGGPGYMGFPGFMGPSYMPATWLGSALSAKGDLLFPIVIFVFVIVGIWTVVQFLLGLIVPLIAGKLAIGKSLIASKKMRRSADPDLWDSHQHHIDDVTQQVVPGLDHGYGEDIEEIDAYY